MNFNKLESLGIYIHFPFCLRKCSYCDFYSLPFPSQELIERYINSLITEIELKAPKYQDTEIKTVYLGGGTPSLIGARQFSLLLTTLNNNFKLANDVEITMEANPKTIEENKLKSYIDAGLNRISLGVQSFFDDELKLLGRSHDVNQIFKTIEIINKLKILNFNIDLIYGIPYQSIENWLTNLELAVSLNPTHISAYLLQLEPTTPLGRKVAEEEILMLDEEIEWQMYMETIDFLANHGYKHYEISNFCKQNYHSKHNMIYWQGLSYLGFGAGAVSFIGSGRCINKPEIVEYINCLALGHMPPSEILEVMNDRELAEDAIIMGLRLTEGINIKAFNYKYKTNLLLDFNEAITDSIAKKLLKIEDNYLKLSKNGYFLSNQVFKQFIRD